MGIAGQSCVQVGSCCGSMHYTTRANILGDGWDTTVVVHTSERVMVMVEGGDRWPSSRRCFLVYGTGVVEKCGATCALSGQGLIPPNPTLAKTGQSGLLAGPQRSPIGASADETIGRHWMGRGRGWCG